MVKIPILQSGYVDVDINGLIKPTEYSDLVIQNVLSKDYRSPSNKFLFNPEIVKLYLEWQGNPDCIKHFEFREKLISLTKRLFKTKTLLQWLEFQNNKVSLSSLHVEFIYDTLRYLCNGKRSMEISQWINLVEKSLRDQVTHVSMGNHFSSKKITEELGYMYSVINLSWNNLIIQWISKPKGTEDLLITMFVIFGNRPYITDVSENPRRST